VAELRVSGKEVELRKLNDSTSCTLRTGDIISIHGQTGEVFAGPRQVRETIR